jgi:hypothetical protein
MGSWSMKQVTGPRAVSDRVTGSKDHLNQHGHADHVEIGRYTPARG